MFIALNIQIGAQDNDALIIQMDVIVIDDVVINIHIDALNIHTIDALNIHTDVLIYTMMHQSNSLIS